MAERRKTTLQSSIFLALCCVLGLFGKRLAAPLANPITDALHIPGGITTAFSLMFLVIAAAITGRRGCAALMGAVQSVLALAFGMVGSMGALAPVGYIMPGVVIDLVMGTYIRPGRSLSEEHTAERSGRISLIRLFLANLLASFTAALTADLIVFHLPLPALSLYLCVAALSGAVCGRLAGLVCEKLVRTGAIA